MKFSDLQPGMTVAFSKHDAQNWANFYEPMMRNPNYTNPEDWYQKSVAMYENKPILIKKMVVIKLGEEFYPDEERPRDPALVGEGPNGEYIRISSKWFNPNDEDTFKQVLSPAIQTDIKMNPARKKKDVAMGELKAMPGAVDYNAAEDRFYGRSRRRKSKKAKKSKKTRRH
jgi:hypothetical protein